MMDPVASSDHTIATTGSLRKLLRSPRTRRVIILLWHCAGVMVCLWLSYLLRFDFIIPGKYRATLTATLPLALVSYLSMYLYFGLFSGLWAYFGMNDLIRTAKAVWWGTVLFFAGVFFMLGFTFSDKPRSVFPLMFFLLLVWEAGGRGLSRHWIIKSRYAGNANRTMRTLLLAPIHEADAFLRNAVALETEIGRVVGVVTDEADNAGRRLQGVPILVGVAEAARHASRLGANHFLVLPPHSSPTGLNQLVRSCADAQVPCTVKTLPTLGDIASGRIEVGSIRRVEIEDLLPRKPNSFDRGPVRGLITGKTVIVTGAGGSIGSELCRQIAGLQPARLILFENSEFALYTIHQELSQSHPGLAIEALAADVRLPEDCRDAMTRFGQVDVIFHAAAYKHVHLMERNIPPAFHNNVLGTARLAEAAIRHGVTDFILVSSDKAVRPTSVMGATKRLAERLLMEQPPCATVFRAVRFGNVMGSSGSVIPHFKRQIANHGPVTVTTPETRRYFMTIPEAVELVLMAGAVGGDRDIMVLEMGEPVKILDLAEKLIELSGFIPHKDIPIVFTGLRPGEKEYEELITDGENVHRTEHEKIWVLNREAAPNAPPVDLSRVEGLVASKSAPQLLRLLGEYIPESPTFNNGPPPCATSSPQPA